MLSGVTATDEVDGDVTDSIVIEKFVMTDSEQGVAEVSFAAFDSSGNVAKFQRQIQYTDYHAPRFRLNAPLIFAQNSNVDVLRRITAEDVFDGDITSRIRATSLSENPFTVAGIHEVEFRITNSRGDKSVLVLPVEIRNYTVSYADVKLSEYLVYLQSGDSFNPRDYLVSFTLNQDTTDLSRTMPSGYKLETSGTVNTGVPGVYPISYTVTYTVPAAGSNAADRVYTGYSQLIVVVEG